MSTSAPDWMSDVEAGEATSPGALSAMMACCSEQRGECEDGDCGEEVDGWVFHGWWEWVRRVDTVFQDGLFENSMQGSVRIVLLAMIYSGFWVNGFLVVILGVGRYWYRPFAGECLRLGSSVGRAED